MTTLRPPGRVAERAAMFAGGIASGDAPVVARGQVRHWTEARWRNGPRSRLEALARISTEFDKAFKPFSADAGRDEGR